ncbi:LacI family transcriptional regulator [Anaerocolumna cellulosilytica]|uniref:LacI family transcriptional regulator n=1 Tax=Anaerocolumna cellulosilytica TaxID=433286 RepID=A0A6S6R788_9FIRM|nr:LacI family DNA-binding transcriptional regulator [Anaerocolumna cellulosilytica]MBB5197600.1 LacI family transcriptional regulator [Anaerocolumna cellulosilytica]BCJ95125.1 LacI family transcriptional regulator [Anaerocolumna cellulosilytica]
MTVTIKDIAKEVGVSYSTVSRALSGSLRTNPQTRERILEAAQRLGYTPNQNAVNLKLAKSYTIGLYFSNISNMSSPFILHDIVKSVYSSIDNSYNVVVKGIDRHEPGSLSTARYDGILILSQKPEDDEFIEEAIAKGIPVVVFNRAVYHTVANILTDEVKGEEEAMEYLLQKGHRKIGIIEGIPNLASTRARHRGWREAFAKYELDTADVPIVTGDYRIMSGYYGGIKLLNQDITAILSFNDEMAFGAARAIEEAGLHIPEDISIVGFDNISWLGDTVFPLTTVERNMGMLAGKATEILFDIIEERKESVGRIYLDTKLIIRNSVKTIH